MALLVESGMGSQSEKRPGLVSRRVAGRFDGVLSLSDKQSAFVAAYVALGGNQTEAAKEAGYSDAAHEGYRLLQSPHVRQAVKAEQERVIGCNLASLGVKTLADLLESPQTPAHVRLGCARFVLEVAGHGPRSASNGVDFDKPLAEMTLAELEAVVA